MSAAKRSVPSKKKPSAPRKVEMVALAPSVLGRPRLYSPKYAQIAYGMTKYGATDFEVCQRLGITVQTLHRWVSDHPDFCEALKIGKKPADERIKRSLFHRAAGYNYVEEEIRVIGDRVVRIPVVKHMPPSEPAIKLWLMNRLPGEWRDKVTVEHTVDDSMRAWMIKAAEAGDIPALTFREDEVIEGDFEVAEDRDINPDDFDTASDDDEG